MKKGIGAIQLGNHVVQKPLAGCRLNGFKATAYAVSEGDLRPIWGQPNLDILQCCNNKVRFFHGANPVAEVTVAKDGNFINPSILDKNKKFKDITGNVVLETTKNIFSELGKTTQTIFKELEKFKK